MNKISIYIKMDNRIIILLIMLILLIILHKTKTLEKNEHFRQCARIINPTCNKKTIYNAIGKLEVEISKLEYIVKSRTLDKSKLNKIFEWYKKQLERESRFQQGAKNNIDSTIGAFAEETENRVSKDIRKSNKAHKRVYRKEMRKNNRLYKPLNLNKM
tara:strand:+ start:1509 stop:1982 length:474 start_codon:yes stop_codon:yes gene_type:complete